MALGLFFYLGYHDHYRCFHARVFQEKEVVLKFIRVMTQVILHSGFRSRSGQRQR
jgi:hypothetical protein